MHFTSTTHQFTPPPYPQRHPLRTSVSATSVLEPSKPPWDSLGKSRAYLGEGWAQREGGALPVPLLFCLLCSSNHCALQPGMPFLRGPVTQFKCSLLINISRNHALLAQFSPNHLSLVLFCVYFVRLPCKALSFLGCLQQRQI